MSETIYLNVQQSSAINRPVVRLQDVAEVFCENKSVQKQVQKLILTEFKGNQEAKQVFSACYLIRQITAAVPNCQVESIGETDFIVYSVGLFLGIILFFNHGGRYKLTNDPSPLQVQMRQYEQGVNQTFITDAERNGGSRDVD